MLTNSRLRNDFKALKIAKKGYVFHGYELCRKTGVIGYLEGRGESSAEEISFSLSLKHEKMLGALLDFLVGNKVLHFNNEKYSLSNNVPKTFSEKEQEFVSKKYPGSEDWTMFLLKHAEETLRKGVSHEVTGFEKKEIGMLWDSVMMGPLYSLRNIAAEELMKNLSPNAKIVDLACGSGASLLNILITAKQPIKLTGADSSNQMLELGRERLEELRSNENVLAENIDNISLLQKDLSKDFLFEEKFDAAFCSVMVHYIPKEERTDFYGKINNLLKSKGKFVSFQLVNKSRFERVFSDWLLHVVPGYHGFPFLNDYLKNVSANFSSCNSLLNGSIVVAYK